MKTLRRITQAMHATLVVAVLACAAPAFAQQSAAPKPRIEKAADLPRFTYKLDAKVEDVVKSRERFAAQMK